MAVGMVGAAGAIHFSRPAGTVATTLGPASSPRILSWVVLPRSRSKHGLVLPRENVLLGSAGGALPAQDTPAKRADAVPRTAGRVTTEGGKNKVVPLIFQGPV